MTIKVQAYQSRGIKTDRVVDDYEFCCWQELFDWMSAYQVKGGLNKCPNCKREAEETYKKQIKEDVRHGLNSKSKVRKR